jgi:glycogen debranching enzyme
VTHLIGEHGELYSTFGVRSSSPLSASSYQARTYWRGPVWANVTWLAALGLERCGETALETDLRRRLVAFARTAGMREYAHPDTGEGLGAVDFTWTAALTAWELTAVRTAAS